MMSVPGSGETPKKSQSQNCGESGEECQGFLRVTAVTFLVCEFLLVCGVVAHDGFVTCQLSVCFD